jgi:fatty-acyl-CoA synthase
VNQPEANTLPALLHEMASRFPQREALVAQGVRITYADLARRVADTAVGLRRLGVQRGDKVAILMGNRPEWVISAFAITTLGAVAVAMNTWWTARELEYALHHSESRFLVCTRRYLRHDYGEFVQGIRERQSAATLQGVIGVGGDLPPDWVPFDSLATHAGESPVVHGASADDVAYMLYTSGSTSRPKGVQLVHRSLVENMWSIGERQHLTEHDKLWLAVSLFWGYGCTNALLTLFTHGGCIVLQESFDAGEALRLIEAERCTVLYGTPNIVQALHEHPDFAQRDLSSLRTGTTLGSPEQVRRAVLLGAREICNVYGMTETYGNSHVTDAHDPLELRLACVGRPLPGVSQRIVDPENEAVLPTGQIGEIRVKGHVTLGYYKDPEQTAKSFDADGYFRTSDLGLIDEDGRLHFRGRLKEMVKTGGINVSPAEIEAVLMDHPDVHLAVVVGVPDPKRDEVLAAVIVPKPQHNPREEDILAYCRQQLAVYKVPKLLRFASETALPLTTTGKVQKNRIAAAFFQ